MPTRLARALVFCAVLSLTLTHAYGQNPINWVGPNGGDWNSAPNWSPPVVPGPTDDVTIYYPTGGLVYLNNTGPAAVDSLTLGGYVVGLPPSVLSSTGGQNLTIYNQLFIAQTGELELQAGDVVTVFSGGGFTNFGVLYVGPGAQLIDYNDTPGVVYANSFYQINGTLTTSYFGSLNSIAGVVYLLNGQSWSIFPDTFGNGTLTITNSGALLLGNGTSVIVGGAGAGIVNNGLLATGFGGSNNYLGMYGTLINNFYFALGNNDTADVFELTNNGYISVGSGATLNLLYQPSGITTVAAGSTFILQGTFNAVGAPVGAPNGFNSLTDIYGTLTISNGQTIQDFDKSGPPMTLTIHSGGSLTVLNGSTFDVHNNIVGTYGANIYTDPSSLIIEGTLYNYGANITVDGNSVFSVGSVVNGGPLMLTHNAGMTVNNGFYQLASGTLGASIDATGLSIVTINGGPVVLDGTLDVLLGPNFDPAIGSFYKFLLFGPGELSGTFASIQNEYFNGTEKWVVIYNNAGGYVELEAAPAPEPGSFLLLGSGLLCAAFGIRRRWM